MPSDKKVKNDYSSVSQKSYKIIDEVNKKTYSTFYTLLSKIKTETEFDFDIINTLFNEDKTVKKFYYY